MSHAGNGAAFLPPILGVRFLVERRTFSDGERWVRENGDFSKHEFAQQQADRLRKQGFTVRVRPVVLTAA